MIEFLPSLVILSHGLMPDAELNEVHRHWLAPQYHAALSSFVFSLVLVVLLWCHHFFNGSMLFCRRCNLKNNNSSLPKIL